MADFEETRTVDELSLRTCDEPDSIGSPELFPAQPMMMAKHG